MKVCFLLNYVNEIIVLLEGENKEGNMFVASAIARPHKMACEHNLYFVIQFSMKPFFVLHNQLIFKIVFKLFVSVYSYFKIKNFPAVVFFDLMPIRCFRVILK
jgi:hypothetical protein